MSGFIMNNIARVVSGATKTFKHKFGGFSQHSGIIPKGCQQPLHLLYNFDTLDPLCPVSLHYARYLPLYYCFSYSGGSVGYRVLSDDKIEILYMESKVFAGDFPYPYYPEVFPEMSISLVPISYKEHKTLVYKIACEDYHVEDVYMEQEDHNFIQLSKYPFTQLGGIQRMWQGVPEEPCPNKKCENHEIYNQMEVLAVVWNQPVPNVYIWDDDVEFRDNVEIQIIFQVCPLCHSIYACNRSI